MFICRPGSGSFVRPKKLTMGVTFLEAVKYRYGGETAATTGGVAENDSNAEEEMYVRGGDAITKVYMVGKDKIVKRQR